MGGLIVKKYAKAIFLSKDLDYFCSELEKLSQAFLVQEFKEILEAHGVSKKQKIEFIESVIGASELKFKNFIKLLGENSRLKYIPAIFEELKRQKALHENVHFGVIYSKEPISKDVLGEFESKLSKRFDSKIQLENKQVDEEGVKISLDSLGYELSFSMQNLKIKLSEYILKAI